MKDYISFIGLCRGQMLSDYRIITIGEPLPRNHDKLLIRPWPSPLGANFSLSIMPGRHNER